MNVTSGLQSALVGIRAGMQSLQGHAENIAGISFVEPGGTPSLVESLIGLKESRIQVAASMPVVKTLDEVIGTLLDVRV
jgi:hypothetical protein